MRNIYKLLVASACISAGYLYAKTAISAEDSKVAAEETQAPKVAEEVQAPKENAVEESTASTQEQKAKFSEEDIKMYWRVFGHIVAQNSHLQNLGTTKDELAIVVQGMQDEILEGKSVDSLTPQQAEDMQAYFTDREQEQIENTKKLGQAFLQEKSKGPDVKKTESGIYYSIVQAGDAMRANDDCSVEIDYEVKLISGKVVDSSYERKERATLYLGMVVPGFREAIRLIGNGGEIQAYIPSNLAYGDESFGPIQGGSLLIVRIKLYKIISPNVDLQDDDDSEGSNTPDAKPVDSK